MRASHSAFSPRQRRAKPTARAARRTRARTRTDQRNQALCHILCPPRSRRPRRRQGHPRSAESGAARARAGPREGRCPRGPARRFR
ncbi:MAG: hypothetical protein B7X11_02795, partial [Acidobacteria bacterium 37-65-4]